MPNSRWSSGDCAAHTPAATAPASAPRAVLPTSRLTVSNNCNRLRGRWYPRHGPGGPLEPGADARGAPARLLVRPGGAAAVLPRVVPPEPDGPRAHPADGARDHRLQPPLVPRPVRDRRDGAPADLLRGEEGALPLPPGRLVAAQLARRVPDRPRRIRPGVDGDRPRDPRTRRHRPHVPRGHAHTARRARAAEARRRAPRARDRRARRPGRRHRHRGGAQGLADPPAQGPHPRRPGAHLPACRPAVARARRRGHRPHLAVRRAAVGVARRGPPPPPPGPAPRPRPPPPPPPPPPPGGAPKPPRAPPP